MEKNIDFKTVFSLTMFIISGLFWIFTINSIPARVTSLEADVRELKTQTISNNVKIDTILDDVKFLKGIMVQVNKIQ